MFDDESFYRFEIYPNSVSKQHNLLVNLAQQNKKSVYYAAPLFYLDADFIKYSRDKIVAIKTKYISCDDLSVIDDKSLHKMCYTIDKNIMFSQPRKISGFVGEGMSKQIRELTAVRFNDLYLNLSEQVLSHKVYVWTGIEQNILSLQRRIRRMEHDLYILQDFHNYILDREKINDWEELDALKDNITRLQVLLESIQKNFDDTQKMRENVRLIREKIQKTRQTKDEKEFIKFFEWTIETKNNPLDYLQEHDIFTILFS